MGQAVEMSLEQKLIELRERFLSQLRLDVVLEVEDVRIRLITPPPLTSMPAS